MAQPRGLWVLNKDIQNTQKILTNAFEDCILSSVKRNRLIYKTLYQFERLERLFEIILKPIRETSRDF